MKNIKNVLFIAIVVFLSSFGVAKAVDTTKIHLDIETDQGSVVNQDVSVTPCDSDNDPSTPDTITAYCALVQLENSGTLSKPSTWSGLWINSINGIANTDSIFWMWLVNLNIDTNPDFTCHQETPAGCSAKQYILNPNDNVLFYYNTNPLKISVDNENPKVGENINITVKELSSWGSSWDDAALGKIIINSDSFDLDENGKYSYEIKNDNALSVKAQKTNFIDSAELTITPIVHHRSSSGSSSSSNVIVDPISPVAEKPTKAKFDTIKSFEFLSSQQKENGSFGEDLYTDWSALALASGNNQNSTIKLIKYFGATKINGTLLTDYERHAMALMTLGLSPYNTNGENYIKKITDSFDGKQFGNVNEDNDDIFALIVLQNTGFTQNEKMINDDISFLLSKQKTNGSWNDSIDMTGAGIEALAFFQENENVKIALIKAKEFLKQNQKDTGGWNNVSSTAWAIEGILALSEKPEDWIKNENTPLDYLAINQDTDGGIKNENLQNKIWETSYVNTALSLKTWNQIMQKFEKIEEKEPIKEIPENKTIIEKIPKTTFVKKTTEEKIMPTENIGNNIEIKPNITQKIDETQNTKKGWLKNLLDKIFSIF